MIKVELEKDKIIKNDFELELENQVIMEFKDAVIKFAKELEKGYHPVQVTVCGLAFLEPIKIKINKHASFTLKLNMPVGSLNI